MKFLEEDRYSSIVKNNDGWYAAVVADSTSGLSNTRLYTMELYYPRIPVHAQLLTHRVFSRNAASNRAIPTKSIIEEVRQNPAMPFEIYKNKPGMSGDSLVSEEEELDIKESIKAKSREMCDYVEFLYDNYKVHKQTVNRYLEPWQFILSVVTSTDWTNFFRQRLADAQPEIRELARLIFQAQKESKTIYKFMDDWHLPYVTTEEFNECIDDDNKKNDIIKVSTGRCANRSSYRGFIEDYDKCITLHNRLLVEGHYSPLEHPCKPSKSFHNYYYNLRTWRSYRFIMDQGMMLYHKEVQDRKNKKDDNEEEESYEYYT